MFLKTLHSYKLPWKILFAHHQMSHFIRFHFFFLRAYFWLSPFVLLQYGLLPSLPLFPYVGAIASGVHVTTLFASFSCFTEEHLHGGVGAIHVRVREEEADGDIPGCLTGRLHCCNQVASCLCWEITMNLRYLPELCPSFEENSGFLLGSVCPTVRAGTCGQTRCGGFDALYLDMNADLYFLSAVPLCFHTGSAAPLSDL